MEWVSVKDRLPETDGQPCLLRMSLMAEEEHGKFHFGEWLSRKGRQRARWDFMAGDTFLVFYPGIEVTHWAAVTDPTEDKST